MTRGRTVIGPWPVQIPKEGHMKTQDVTITEDQIVVNRQALPTLVSVLDMGGRVQELPAAMDKLREPFFPDEFSTGKARTDFSMNKYEF